MDLIYTLAIIDMQRRRGTLAPAPRTRHTRPPRPARRWSIRRRAVA